MIPAPPAASCLSASVVSVAQIAAQSILAFVNTDQNSGASVEGVTAAVAGGGIHRQRASKATQEQLSPDEERLSSCARLHLCRLACASTVSGEKRGALEGFG